MTTGRLEAFSDGVLAIVITIMVLELKVPHDPGVAALRELLPVFLTYLLSFAFVGIYWSNHHHLMLVTERVNGAVLWANLHLLFWLSLIPFVTGWMGENEFAPLPVALYGVVMIGCAVAYSVLTTVIIRVDGAASRLAHAIGPNRKGKVSLALYVAALPLALLVDPRLALGVYVTVALLWLVPDSRIERALRDAGLGDRPAA